MGIVHRIYDQLPSSSALPTFHDLTSMRKSPRWAFLKRRIRLKGNSSISIPLGVIIFFPLTLIILLILLARRSDEPSSIFQGNPGLDPGMRKISEKYDRVFATGCLEPEVNAPRANATFVVLARNKELDGVVQSLKSIERHFNRWFHYPYVFLNDKPFNSTFKEVVQSYTSGPVEFGMIDPDTWNFPSWADKEEVKEAIAKQGDEAIMYGGMESYHKMCRFYSGYFYKHSLLQKYKWYWRLEPEITYFCDITYDPFIHMERANKTYGWTIAVKELEETVPNLFRYVSAFKRTRKLQSQGLWEMFLEPPPKTKSVPPLNEEDNVPIEGKPPQDVDPAAMESESYNMCHFWSNFEIARLDFFRSPQYEDFFNMLEKSGGFWTERWGDAPVHSLAAGVLLGPQDIHYFRDFGYRHTTIQHCPSNAPKKQLPHIPWYDKNELDKKKAQREDDYWAKHDPVRENGVGCRCRCDIDITDVEGKPGSCIPQWVEAVGGWAS